VKASQRILENSPPRPHAHEESRYRAEC